MKTRRISTTIPVVMLAFAVLVQLRAEEMVSVTGTNGKRQVGELMSADPDKIVLRDGDGKSAEIPWKDIQKMSSGLTRESALKRWKEANKDKLCKVCNGDRVMSCPTCKGSGTDTSKTITCAACKGTG